MRTDTHVPTPEPNLFVTHPNLSDEINRKIVQSEIEGGVHLDDLVEGEVLKVETRHHEYTIVNRGGGQALISGHPKFCPDPVAVRIDGSSWGGSMLKARYIGRGMRLEFRHPVYCNVVTSYIVEVRAADQVPNMPAACAGN